MTTTTRITEDAWRGRTEKERRGTASRQCRIETVGSIRWWKNCNKSYSFVKIGLDGGGGFLRCV